MSNIVIRVENLSKQYRLGKIGTGSFAHDVNRWWHKVRGKEDPYLKVGEINDRSKKGESNYVWSLQDINFDINQGEAVGIIGRNGAGKSTLLKILSRTTAPTTGKIKIKGRVASLLEVGTGFHPELTGRENIFLNGAILGMTKAEIKSRFDEIVDFSGVERYIDTPVKRYSSGMYVRLAFGVAAHLEPEILVVDEVLAVGDAEFQQKALGKMKNVSESDGRTVLFVSHNMAAIRNLCTKGVMLKNGRLSQVGDIEKVIDKYLNDQQEKSSLKLADINRNAGNEVIKFTEIRFRASDGDERKDFTVGEALQIDILYETKEELVNCKKSKIDIGINDLYGHRVAWMSSNIYMDKLDAGKSGITFYIDRILLNEGTYNINLYCETDMGTSDWLQNVSRFNVHYDDFYGTGRQIPPKQGYIITEFKIK